MPPKKNGKGSGDGLSNKKESIEPVKKNEELTESDKNFFRAQIRDLEERLERWEFWQVITTTDIVVYFYYIRVFWSLNDIQTTSELEKNNNNPKTKTHLHIHVAYSKNLKQWRKHSPNDETVLTTWMKFQYVYT